MFRLMFACALAFFLGNSGGQAHASSVISIGAGSTVASGAFVADTDYSGGTPYNNPVVVNTGNVVNPAPQQVYQNLRYGNFTYVIPGLVANSSYLVRLHFAEVFFHSAGSRVFNVLLNNNSTPVLNHFDIFAASGGFAVANIQEIPAMADANGNLTLQFVSLVDNAQVNGIEITANGLTPTPNPSYNLNLSSDHATYAVGSRATVLLTLTGMPEDPDSEFFVSATFNGAPISLTRVTASESYAVTPALAAGNGSFVATLFQQNSRLAASLADAVDFYQRDIAALTADLATETDPSAIAVINAKIAHDQDRLSATQAQQASIRTQIGNPVNLNIFAH